MTKFYHIIASLVVGFLLLSAAEARAQRANYVRFAKPDSLRPHTEYADSLLTTVLYPINTASLEQAPPLAAAAAELNEVLADPDKKLLEVWVLGAASPDGPEARNKYLSRLRATWAVDYLRKTTHIPENKLRVEVLGEDWEDFARLVKRSDSPYRDEILDVLAKWKSPVDREYALRRQNKGATWTWLSSDVFPELRSVRFAIFCLYDPKVIPATPRFLEPVATRSAEFAPSPFQAATSAPTTGVTPEKADPWRISIKTNALFYAMLVPSIGFEVQLGRRWSFDMLGYWSPYNLFSSTRKFRIFGLQPEVRYWWGEPLVKGHYLGLHGHVLGFNVQTNDGKRYQDPNHALWGAGLAYGYAMPLGKSDRWGVEFTIGAGYAKITYDVYDGQRNGRYLSSGTHDYWGITRLGVDFSYRFLLNKKRCRK